MDLLPADKVRHPCFCFEFRHFFVKAREALRKYAGWLYRTSHMRNLSEYLAKNFFFCNFASSIRNMRHP